MQCLESVCLRLVHPSQILTLTFSWVVKVRVKGGEPPLNFNSEGRFSRFSKPALDAGYCHLKDYGHLKAIEGKDFVGCPA